MRVRNLSQVLIYKPVKIKNYGEYTTKWIYEGTAYLSIQQNLSELDRNGAGEIDYESKKLYTDLDLTIEKGYGISCDTTDGIRYNDEIILFDSKTIMLEGMETIDNPDYIISSKTRVGRSTVYVTKTNNGE